MKDKERRRWEKEVKHYRQMAIFSISFVSGFIAVVLIAIGVGLLLH